MAFPKLNNHVEHFLNVLVGHLDNFFGEMSIFTSFAHYLFAIVALFIVDLNVFIIYFGYNIFIRYV